MALALLAASPASWPAASSSAIAPARSLFTAPLPWILPEGSFQATGAPSVSLRTPQPFHESGERTERTAVAVPVEVAGALSGNVEASLSFGAARTGGRDDSDGATPSDTALRVVYSFPAGPAWMDSLAAWLGAKAPTGPDRGGISTDETDLLAGASAGWTAGKLSFFGQGGLALLGNPLRNGSQDDVAVYGAGAVWQPGEGGWLLSGELEGRAFSRFGNSGARIHAGAAWRGAAQAAVLSVGGVVFHALNDDAATWGARLFLSAARF